MAVRQAGGTVYLEPDSKTTYIPPPPCSWWDLPFFMLRWSEEWNIATARHFNTKWAVSRVVHISDTSSPAHDDTILRFGRGHRRLMTGLRISETDEDRPTTPLEQAELMIAIFQSVDRETFDCILTSGEPGAVESMEGLSPQALFEKLPHAIEDTENSGLRLLIDPRQPNRSYDPVLIRLDHLSAERMKRIKPYAFLTLEHEPGQYQCWIAVDRGTWRDAAMLRRLGTPSTRLNSFVHVAGTPNEKRSRVRLVEACAGLAHTVAHLDKNGILPLIRNAIVY
jgi:hypothetical protein